MNGPQPLKVLGYVDQPYEAVRNLLQTRGGELLQRATLVAGDRTQGLIARLRVGAAGLEVGVDVRVEVSKQPSEPAVAGLPEVTHLGLSWKAAHGQALFPSMRGDLSATALTFGDTRIAFEGVYTPPFKGVGKALDALIGHRIAEAAVHRFVLDMVEQIRRELPVRSEVAESNERV
jgi:hypothetical protein